MQAGTDSVVDVGPRGPRGSGNEVYCCPNGQTFCAGLRADSAYTAGGVDRIPSGECPPHSGDRAPCVWDFLHDDFSRLPLAGSQVCLEAGSSGLGCFSGAGTGGSGAGWANPVCGGGGQGKGCLLDRVSEPPWELLKLFGLQHQEQ